MSQTAHAASKFRDLRLATAWAIIESRQAGPLMIIVVGATELDATQPVARALCEASEDAGKRTGYLYLGTSNRLVDRLASRFGTGNGALYDDLSFPNGSSQRQAFDAALPDWRSAYEVIIVDVPEFSKVPAAAHIARIADGAVIALFADRRIMPADREIKSIMAQLDTPILGVVCTTKHETESSLKPAATASPRGSLLPVRQQ